MTNAEIFHQTMTPYGGRLAWEQRAAGKPAAELYAHITKLANHAIDVARQQVPRLPPIYFDFVHNGNVNAWAWKEHNQYFIGITSGIFYLLQLIFCRMLSDSRVLTHVGDPGGEASNLPLLSGLIPHAQRMCEAGSVPKPPETEPRWLYSCHLLDQAVLFVLGHELAHITRGHVDYLGSKTGSPLLPEIGWNQSGPIGEIERQTLEVDADRRSFISRIESVRLRVYPIRGSGVGRMGPCAPSDTPAT